MSAAENQKTVLLVDDDAEFLELFQPNLDRLSCSQWNIHVVTDAGQALKVLETHQVDMAVIDMRMPVVDGAQFLHLLQRKYPQLKKAVLSGYIDDACRARSISEGAELVLEKPRSAEGLEIVFAALNELLHWEPERGFQGMLRRVGLEDILQMECLSRHSLVLEIEARHGKGRIYIRSGNLEHAEFGELTGEAALQELLTLTGGEFRHLPAADPPARTLGGPWELLVMEAVRKRDEITHGVVNEEEAAPAPAEPNAITETAPAVRRTPEIEEFVVCSPEGELLYEWQSPDAANRCHLLRALNECSNQFQALLAIGSLERIDFLRGGGRMIARLQDGHGIFLRANAG